MNPTDPVPHADRPLPKASLPRRALRLARAVLGVAVVVPVVSAWARCPAESRWHRPWARLVMRLMCWAFRMKVRVEGTPLTGPGLMVANHLSWSDICVLGACTDAAFVAKAEIIGWPALGTLTRLHGGEFIERGRRGDAAERGLSLEARWADADGLHRRPYVLFAEGTTSGGGEVAPFFPALFMPAVRAGVPVQPVALRYRADDGGDGGRGTVLSGAALRRVAWVGDDLLVPHMLAMATGAPLIVEVWFAPPLPAGDRKALARDSRAAIMRHLGYAAD